MIQLKELLSSCGVFIILSLALTACDSDDDIKIEWGNIYGVANAEPSSFMNGDNIIFSIGGISVGNYVKMDGKEYYPTFHYLLDGEEVAVSSEKELPFRAQYTANGLTPGEHTLSVDITAPKQCSFENKIVSSTIIVIKDSK